MKIKKYKDIKETIFSTILPNNMKVYLNKKTNFSRKYAIICAKFGSFDSTRKIKINGSYKKINDGLAHFLEHRMFTIKDKDASDLFAKNGANTNAFTTYDKTCYYFDCYDNFFDNLKILLQLVDSFDSSFKQVETEKGIIIEELKMYKDDPYTVLFNSLNNQAYKKHPIKIDIGGSEASVQTTNFEMLKEVFNRFYDPSNLILFICGDVDENELEKFLNDNLLKVKNPQKIKKLKFYESEVVFSNSAKIKMDINTNIYGMLLKLEPVKSIKLIRKNNFIYNMILDYLFSLSSKYTQYMLEDNIISSAMVYELVENIDLSYILLYNEVVDYKRLNDYLNKLFNEKITINMSEFNRLKNKFYGNIVKKYSNLQISTFEFINLITNNQDYFNDLKILKTITLDDLNNALQNLSKVEKFDCVVGGEKND